MKKTFSISVFSICLIALSVSAENIPNKWEYKKYSGKIDNKYKIDMTIISANSPDVVTGYYSYNGSRNTLKLTGYKENEIIKLNEYDSNQKMTGSFTGQFVGDSFKGDWQKPQATKKSTFYVTRSYNNNTLVKDLKTKNSLIGNNNCSLQWISWDKFGTLKVEEKDKKLIVTGSQKLNGDTLEIDGYFTMIDTNRLDFNGKIVTQVSHINSGSPCFREGDMTFMKYENRNHWRLQEMNSPCSDVTDYVDISVRKK